MANPALDMTKELADYSKWLAATSGIMLSIIGTRLAKRDHSFSSIRFAAGFTFLSLICGFIFLAGLINSYQQLIFKDVTTFDDFKKSTFNDGHMFPFTFQTMFFALALLFLFWGILKSGPDDDSKTT